MPGPTGIFEGDSHLRCAHGPRVVRVVLLVDGLSGTEGGGSVNRDRRWAAADGFKVAVLPGSAALSSTRWRTLPDPTCRWRSPDAASRIILLEEPPRGKPKNQTKKGYVHEVHHDPARVQAEAARLDVASCRRRRQKPCRRFAARHLASNNSRLETILFKMVRSSAAEISMSWMSLRRTR